MLPDELDAYLDKPKKPRDRVHSIASRAGISPDLADDYLKVTNVESGHNINVRNSSKGARGFGQVMPDVKGGTTRTVGGRKYNLLDPNSNIEAGLRYFAEGGSDPVARRLHYFGGPGAKRRYEKTGRIPNISDGNMTAEQYVKATGARRSPQQQQPKDELDFYLDPLDDYLDKPAATPAPTPIKRFKRDPFAGLKAGVGGQQQPSQQQRQLSPTESLLESVGGREKRGEDIQNILEGVTGAVGGSARQLANAQDLGMQITGMRALGVPNPVSPRIRKAGEYLETAVAENEAARPAPTTFAGNVRRGVGKGIGASVVEMPKLLLGGRVLGAANLPVQGALSRAEEGVSGIVKGAAGGLVYHYGGALTGKAFAGVSPYLAKVGNSLVWIAGPVVEQQIAAKVTGSEAPNLAQSIGENIPFGIMAGMGARGKVRVKTPRGERDATEADLPKILKKQLEVVPPERGEVDATTAATPEMAQARPRGEGSILREEARGVPAESVPTSTTTIPELREGVSTGDVSQDKPSQRFYHRDYGEVVRLEDQSGSRRGKTKVAEADNPDAIHYVKTAQLTGAGNQRMVPLKPETKPETDLDPYLDSPAQPTEQAAGKPLTVEAEGVLQRPLASVEGGGKPQSLREHEADADLFLAALNSESRKAAVAKAVADVESKGSKVDKRLMGAMVDSSIKSEMERLAGTQQSPSPTTVEHNGRTYTRNDSGEWRRDDGRVVKGVVEEKLNEIQKQKGEPPNALAQLPASEAGAVAEAKTKPVSKQATDSGAGRAKSSLASLSAPQQSTTAAKRTAVTADRAERNLPPITKPERKADADLLDSAKEASAADPSKPLRLAEEVLRSPRGLSDKETVQLDLRQQQLKNEYDRLNKEIAESTDAETIKRRGAESDALESEMSRIEEAWAASGTEKGRALRSQRIAIDQDFRLLTMVSKLKKDKGRDLRPEERQRVEEQHKQIEELTVKLAEAESRAAEAQLQKQIDKVVRQRRRGETKVTLDEEFADLKTQFAQVRLEVKESPIEYRQGGIGLASFDPSGKLTPIIAQMARNRVKAGTVKAEALVDEIHAFISEHVPDVSKRDVRDAISGYGIEPQSRQRNEAQAQLASIKNDLKQLSASEDIAAGKRLSRADKMRQTNLLKQEAELTRRMAEKDYSDAPKRTPPQYTRETYEIQKRLEGVKQQYARDRYKATRSTTDKFWDRAAQAASIPKTLKSIADVSAVLRQGGFYSFTHPRTGLIKPTRDMLQSFTDMGYRNVEAQIQNDPAYPILKKAGVEFTGVDKNEPQLSRREEGYLGGEYIDLIAKGKYNYPGKFVKGVKDFSERTFVSFLDAQRLYIGKQMLDGLTPAQRSNPAELKALAGLINAGTGRGNLGSQGNKLTPALNILMFSPRLVASRVQLLNNMISPRKLATMPAGARKAMIKDNVKFLGAMSAFIGLARAAGASVSLDPDDAEFLKIRFGNTVYDQLTGLQQPMRFIINMGRAASPVDSKLLQAGSTYPGKSMKQQIDPFEGGSFTRSKLNPALSPLVNFAVGEDFMGRKFSAKREARDLVVPLPANDVIEAMQQEGLIGLPKALPTFVGIGVGSYPPSPDRPTTHAEKLARRFIREKMPDKAREDEEIETDRAKAQARAKSRRGENVSDDIAALKGRITPRQIKGILAARNKTRLQEDFAPLGINEATLVYSVADADQQRKLKPLLQKKIPLYYTLLPSQQGAVRDKLNSFGIKVGAPRATQ